MISPWRNRGATVAPQARKKIPGRPDLRTGMLEPESQAGIKAWQRFTAIVCDYRRRAEGFRQSLWVAAGPLAARTGSRYKIGEAPRKEGALRDTLTKRKESVHAKTLAYYDAWIV